MKLLKNDQRRENADMNLISPVFPKSWALPGCSGSEFPCPFFPPIMGKGGAADSFPRDLFIVFLCGVPSRPCAPPASPPTPNREGHWFISHWVTVWLGSIDSPHLVSALHLLLIFNLVSPLGSFLFPKYFFYFSPGSSSLYSSPQNPPPPRSHPSWLRI